MSTANAAPDLYAVIGYPVKQSFSPFIHAQFARQTAQHLEYRKIEASPDELHGVVRKFFFETGGKGMNVTIPHKQAVMSLCQTLTPRAQLAGAVNTLALQGGALLGDNTDGVGLIADLTKNLQVHLRGARVLLLGAGGAARGVIAPLLAQALSELRIANRDAAKAIALAKQFQHLGAIDGGGYDNLQHEFDLIVNATAASLQGDVPPIPHSCVSARTLCYDMAYAKTDTAFTNWAKQRGAARAELGWGMLVEQAAESFYVWRGVRPDTDPVLKAVRSSALDPLTT